MQWMVYRCRAPCRHGCRCVACRLGPPARPHVDVPAWSIHLALSRWTDPRGRRTLTDPNDHCVHSVYVSQLQWLAQSLCAGYQSCRMQALPVMTVQQWMVLTGSRHDPHCECTPTGCEGYRRPLWNCTQCPEKYNHQLLHMINCI